MMVVDTHVLIWAVQDDVRLGRKARDIIDDMTRSSRLMVSAITIWEIAMLTEKGRISLGDDVARWTDRVLALPGIVLVPLEPQIAIGSVRLPDDFHADPADRIIAATARHHQVPLMTADQAILHYAARGHVVAIDAAL